VKDNNALIINAQIFNGYQIVPANAIYVQNGMIKAIGDKKDLQKQFSQEIKTIDATNKFLMPAFIEGHGHFTSVGYAKMKVDLRFTKSWNEVLALVEAAIKNTPEGSWIEGEGWHQEKWNELPEMIDGFPTNEKLNALTGKHPIALLHAARHSALVNNIALQQVGFEADTNIEGGKIVCSSDNKMTGALEENAINPIRSSIANSYKAQEENRFTKAVKLATKACHINGITSFHDAHSSLEDWQYLNALENENRLNINLWLMMHETVDRMNQLISHPLKTKHLQIGAIKRYMDGALGNRGSWFFESYSDKENAFGHCTLNQKEYEQICRFAAEHNLQMCTHAIGDRANHQVLKTYENVIEHYELQNHRWRVEHAQHLQKADINLFKENNILASIQTNHCTSDLGYVEQRLGKQRSDAGAYLWQTLWKENIHINNGTDCPIEPINPIKNFYSAVTRKNEQGVSFNTDEVLSRQQALQTYTINNAYAAKQEKVRGSIELNKTADLVLLDNNLLLCEEENINATKVIWTMKNGEICHHV